MLKEVSVRGNRYTSPIKTKLDGAVVWNLQQMNDLPKILGNADPVHYAQMLPGIQTNNEYKSGINIQGCESSHNGIFIGNVPIYNVSHLLGFFSTFNASHYPTMQLQKIISSAAFPNRLGGELDMNIQDDVSDSISGELSVGLISSQGTLRLPINKKTSITVSLRGSYINLVYGHWMKVDDMAVDYSFFDSNLTLIHRIDDANSIIADFYAGADMGTFDQQGLVNMNARWGNYMGSLHWLHTSPNGLSAKNTIYYTSYRNSFDLGIQTMSYKLPSNISDLGWRTALEWKRLTGGVDIAWHDINPQIIRTEGTYNKTQPEDNQTNTCEASLYVDYTQPLIKDLNLTLGLRGSIYGGRATGVFASADPSVFVSYDNYRFQLSAGYSLRHQYLFQTGFSDMGMPTEFWLSCDKNNPPQYAHAVAVNASVYLFGRMFRISFDAFYKKLCHQIEYNGSVLDFLNEQYDVNKCLLHGNGRNYGFSVMLNKCSGKLTGWISYAYTQAKRTFVEKRGDGEFPASHERPHEIDIVATYAPWKHWSFGATFVYATGTPFTAPTNFLLINTSIITQFGEYNANRLRPYYRLDASVNYKWKGRHIRENGINLSLYNVTCHENDLFYHLKVKSNGTTFVYRPVSFIVDILPSISYFCKF